jgi:hypothetical protein
MMRKSAEMMRTLGVWRVQKGSLMRIAGDSHQITRDSHQKIRLRTPNEESAPSPDLMPRPLGFVS